MQQAERGKGIKLWLGLVVVGLSLAITVPSVQAAEKKGLADSIDRMAIHGYVDNFTILRNTSFVKDYHVASSRYRASVQMSGPLYMLRDYFQRFEYFIELRPEYESIYDIDDKFGNGRKGEGKQFVSGRTDGAKGGVNGGFLTAFGFDPGNFGEFWPNEAPSSIRFPYNLVPGSNYGVPGRFRDSRDKAYFGLDMSQNDLRFGMLRETNMDLYYPVREAYLDFFWKGMGGRNWLRIGKQQHVWGKADFFRLQDLVNPVNFADHFFIDLFDDTRVPLWSALFEHRFGNVGFLRDVAGSVVYTFDRYAPLGFGNSSQPWSIGFGRTIDAFGFGNDLFARALFPDHSDNPADENYVPFLNMALYKNRSPHWSLKNGGIGTRWEATVGNFRLQITDWFAFNDVPAFGWDRINIFNTPDCTTDGAGNSILPTGSAGGTLVNGDSVIVGVKPNQIKMRDANHAVVQGAKGRYKKARYANMCGFGGSLAARYRKQNTLGLSFDWFEPNTGVVVRWESSWTANAILTDTTKSDLIADGNVFRWVLGVDRPTLIRWLNPTRSFFLSAQAYGTHYPDNPAGRYGLPNGAQDNFIATFFVQNQFMRDQLVWLVFGAFGTTATDGTTGGNIEYLINNNWSVTLGATAFLGKRTQHDLTTFAVFTGDPANDPFSEAGFGIGHMQAGGSERNQMNEFWGRLRYRF